VDNSIGLGKTRTYVRILIYLNTPIYGGVQIAIPKYRQLLWDSKKVYFVHFLSPSMLGIINKEKAPIYLAVYT
jgi:hypothetical protein